VIERGRLDLHRHEKPENEVRAVPSFSLLHAELGDVVIVGWDAALAKELKLEANELHEWLPGFLVPVPGIAHVSAPVSKKRSVFERMWGGAKDAVTSGFGMRGS
jgi:hypothetical protein